jgi:Ca2+-binding RTX toxin-like protein
MRVLLACVVLLLAPAVANGATVFVEQDGLHFEAGFGETNQVTIEDGALVQVTDAGARLTAGGSCVSTGPHTVQCTMDFECPNLSGPYNEHWCGIHVDLGNRDDTLDVGAAIATTASGGEGDDRMLGGPGADRLSGGPGADFMQGRGSGYDTVAYDEEGRTAGVSVRLDDLGNDGSPGENDNARAEQIIGTPYADLIVANGVDNLIEGAGGADRVRCRGGRDLAYTADVGLASVGCEDVLADHDATLFPVCGVRDPLVLEKGVVDIMMCAGEGATGRVRLATTGGERLAAAAVRLPRGGMVHLRIPRAARRLLRRAPEWKVRVTGIIPGRSMSRAVGRLKT